MISITVNGKTTNIPPETTISGYLAAAEINAALVVVEHNRSIPPKQQWGEIILNEADMLEIVKFIGGG